MKECEYDSIVVKTVLADLFIFGIHSELAQKSLLKEEKGLLQMLYTL